MDRVEQNRPGVLLAFVLGILGAFVTVVYIVIRRKAKNLSMEDKLFLAHAEFTSTPPTQLNRQERKIR